MTDQRNTLGIDFADNPAEQRIEARIDGQLAGFVAYDDSGGRKQPLRLVHTEVLPAFEGRGVAGALARHVLDGARSRGERVVPACSYIATWIERHPDYAGLVAG
ncbi:GNAT family N-acetyltransferase [Xylophilus sp.]|uniref:GNAT family N-acetyltransferase n=1 Tax=Xylophilus sp. TaxID=2653893 RepID=UPI0013BB5AA4|nr:GNAT family N-acetyltransferase [Xylophilus sp.]KAF1044704.1 MAG: hypothetical protein GAK38_03422 [Xylophilus sp.]